MGVGRAVVLGALAIVPGVVLALLGWLLSGAPAEWSVGLNLACYGPFFGCIIAGFVIGLRSDDSEMEE